MNFLEELVAEWYEYSGYFVRRNLKFGKLTKGGYTGEIDIAAFDPAERTLVHIEVSSDTYSWKKRTQRFRKKFADAAKHYDEVLPFEKTGVQKKAIVGFAKQPRSKPDFGKDVEIVSVRDFVDQVSKHLKSKDVDRDVVPEGFPLLRAMQFALHYWVGA